MKKTTASSVKYAMLDTAPFWIYGDGTNVSVAIVINEDGMVQCWLMLPAGGDSLSVVFDRALTPEGLTYHELPRDESNQKVFFYPVALSNLRGHGAIV